MEKYLIHTCRDRFWYVNEYLIPSMREQGISDILVYEDKRQEGQLVSLMKSHELIGDADVWHLQDDIIISKNFRQMTEAYNKGIVCGFCNSYSEGKPGYVNMSDMWYSMLCIRIPGDIFGQFIKWLDKSETRKEYRPYFLDNKHDDAFLNIFLNRFYSDTKVYNLAPNIVNHIDHLIGGSVLNKDRDKTTSELMATYWEEPELLVDIETRLRK